MFLILLSLQPSSSLSNKQNSTVLTKTTNSNVGLHIIIKNISIVYANNLSQFYIKFQVVNTLNQTITIITPGSCTPFRSFFFIFEDGGNYTPEDGVFPYICGQVVTTHYYKPGAKNESFYYNINGYTNPNGKKFPNGTYYVGMYLNAVINSPANCSIQTSTVEFRVTNNKISNFTNYTSKTNLFVNAYSQIQKFSLDSKPLFPIYSLNPNYLEFSINFSIKTLNNTVLYPRSLEEEPLIYLQLKNLDLNWTFKSSYPVYPVNQSGVYGPGNFSGVFSFDLNSTLYNVYNRTSIPNGEYSATLYDVLNLIPNNNTSFVTFYLQNKTLSNIQIENFNATFGPFSDATQVKYTDGFTIIVFSATIIVLDIALKFKRGKKN